MSLPLIHVAKIENSTLLLLRKSDDGQYTWFKEDFQKQESPTSITGISVEEAMQKAHSFWKKDAFRSIICGFRYTLPERDEHGMNALFHQMVSSYKTFNGTYFDEELGHNCFVDNASQEALTLWKKLAEQNRL